MPVEKVAGARVLAGSINQSGALDIVAESIGRDTSYGKIIDAVERDERSRARARSGSIRSASFSPAFGFLNPLLAAAIHVGSELAFILNAARLLPALQRSVETHQTYGEGSDFESEMPRHPF
jgi:cation transport ATPase